MQDMIITIGIGVILLTQIIMAYFIYLIIARERGMAKTLNYQNNLIIKIQSILKNKSATNAVAENAERI